MSGRTYRDFVLVANNVAKNERGLVEQFTVRVFDSPVGQGEVDERVTIADPQGLIRQLRLLEKRGLDEDVGDQMALGGRLAGLLLPSYARELLRRSLDRVAEEEGIRLRLRLADELADYPWEYLYVQNARGENTPSGFLALHPRISIARHEAVAVPGDWFEAPASRRIVVAMASPEPHDAYPRLSNLAQERQSLRDELDHVAGLAVQYLPQGATDLVNGEMPGATAKQLVEALMERTDIFHFSGHGEFRGEIGPAFGTLIGEGAIVLADRENQAVPVSADRLGEMLQGRGVRLVVLGACETGRRDGQNVWSSVAASLLKVGIPAVVAMQYTIQDDLAAAFMAAFYRALVLGSSVDEAVSVGRTAIRTAAVDQGPHRRDWGAPVLYLRAPNGVVFNPVSDKSARKEAEQGMEHLFEQQARVVEAGGALIGPVIDNLATEAVRVNQRVHEEAGGVVIGAYVFSVQGGRLTVKQNLDTVSGTVVGARIRSIGGQEAQPPDDEQVTADLERLLRLGGS